jgi:hypothetical protein
MSENPRNPIPISIKELVLLKQYIPNVTRNIEKIWFGIGWLQLFKDLCLRLECINNKLPEGEKFYITCAKEKFGRLTVYIGNDKLPFNYHNEEASKILTEYSNKSTEICEYTGEKAKTYKFENGRIATMSPNKAKELNAQEFSWQELYSSVLVGYSKEKN